MLQADTVEITIQKEGCICIVTYYYYNTCSLQSTIKKITTYKCRLFVAKNNGKNILP